MNVEEFAPLSYDYVFNYIFKKLADTFDKYRPLLPILEEVEQAIVSGNEKDPFEATIGVIQVLQDYSEKSELVKEIFENLYQDFWHGVKPNEVPKYEGQFYISSVTD